MRELLHILKSRIRALLKRRQLQRDLQDELQFHLLEKQSAMEASGIPPQQAQSLAQRQFGNPTLTQELCREAWIFRSLDKYMRDARYAVRVLAKNRTFTAVAVLTLAFGVGTNTAIFSVINSVVLQALPYKEPGQLYVIKEVLQQGAERLPLTCVNAGNFRLWGPHAQSFTGMTLLMPTTDNLDLKDATVQIHGVRASASLFAILGIQLHMGRPFTVDEDRSGGASSVILTDALWKQRFQSNPTIVGSTIHLNGFPLRVAGVLPESFYFPNQNELYSSPIAGWTHPIEYFVNLGLQPWETLPGLRMFNFAAIGRLAPGASIGRAIAQLDVGEAQALKGDLTGAQLQIDLAPLKASIVGPAEHNLWMLMSGAALVLVLVCVNVAGLLIAKGTGRVHEIGLRMSLGASRSDIVRQFLIEAMVLSVAGGMLGLMAAHWGIRALVQSAPIEIPRLQSIGIDAKVLLFNLVLSLASGILFSLLPAFRLSRETSSGTLKPAGPNASADRSISRMHQALAASEIALCTVLLIAAFLIAQSLVHVLNANVWANVSRVVTVSLTIPANRYQKNSLRERLYNRLLDGARNVPGVEAAGIVNALPFKGEMWGDDVEFLETPKPEKHAPNANWRLISPDYFRAAGVPLKKGRYLSQSDWGRHLIVISERLARQLPGHINPVGAHVSWKPPSLEKPVVYEVVGVVADTRATPDEEAPFTVYVPYWEEPPWGAALVVRAGMDAPSVAASLQQLVRNTDREIAIPGVETMQDILSKAVAPRRFVTFLGLTFAASATFLAALGLYGLISLAVSQRTREIGVRLAIGAQTEQILKMMISQAIGLAAVGLSCGVVCAWAATRFLRAFLYEVKPADPFTFAGVCAALLLVSIAASYVPARRATKVDPVRALKWE